MLYAQKRVREEEKEMRQRGSHVKRTRKSGTNTTGQGDEHDRTGRENHH